MFGTSKPLQPSSSHFTNFIFTNFQRRRYSKLLESSLVCWIKNWHWYFAGLDSGFIGRIESTFIQFYGACCLFECISFTKLMIIVMFIAYCTHINILCYDYHSISYVCVWQTLLFRVRLSMIEINKENWIDNTGELVFLLVTAGIWSIKDNFLIFHWICGFNTFGIPMQLLFKGIHWTCWIFFSLNLKAHLAISTTNDKQ